jgi:hypothetical protein
MTLEEEYTPTSPPPPPIHRVDVIDDIDGPSHVSDSDSVDSETGDDPAPFDTETTFQTTSFDVSDVEAEEPTDDFPDLPEPKLEQLRTAWEFVKELREASHENSGLSDEFREHLLNPLQETFQIDDPNHRLSLEIFLATTNASRKSYDLICQAVQLRNPGNRLLSYYQISRKVADWTGIQLVRDDMCVGGCLGFTGPFKDHLTCATCGADRYDPIVLKVSKGKKQVPRQQFYSLLLGPQIQAQWAHPESAKAMRYGVQQLKSNVKAASQNNGEIPLHRDIFSGEAILERFQSGQIKDDDTMLLFSTDGAQLYCNKQSDVWIGIFTMLNLPPNLRYKNTRILPAVIIPGPCKPKDTDSFFFRAFHHLNTLMKDGLWVWDAAQSTTVHSTVHLLLVGADGPGLTCLDGGVGHQGAHGCRLHCPMKGRLKPGGSHYYPALKLPGGSYAQKFPSSAHDDIDPAFIASWEPTTGHYLANLKCLHEVQTPAEYNAVRLQTGLVKPSILLGFPLNLSHNP